jgi:DNA polymerase/3'-5' exonuclease PolX
MNYSVALQIANDIIQCIEPTCEPGFCVVGGGLRRKKTDVHDIEIVAKPIMRSPRPEFGAKVLHKTLLDQALYELQIGGLLTRIKGADKMKQYKINLSEFGLAPTAEPFLVEFWLCTPPSEWGVHYTIRTGPSEFSKWMVTEKRKGGALPDGYICEDNAIGHRIAEYGSKDRRNGMIAMPTEKDFFEFCGLKWIEPSKREARWGKGK